MRIAFPYNNFPGGFLESIKKSFDLVGFNTFMIEKFNSRFTNKILRNSSLIRLHEIGIKNNEIDYNNFVLDQLLSYKPNVFFNYSGSNLFPSTLEKIKKNSNISLICYIADNPCDPDPRRDKYFPMTLRYYDYLLNPESTWDKILKNLAPNSKIIKFLGGYEKDNFFPVKTSTSKSMETERFNCEVSFTGGSYGESAEGAYRSGIISQLSRYDVQIYGDIGWKYRFLFYPQLLNAYKGNRLNYEELRYLYSRTKINLNMPSPQITTSFQPRVFDIAATKGFQIIDHSDELLNIFGSNNFVTFNSIPDLLKKIDYYLSNEQKRNEIAEIMYEIIVDEYTWYNQIKILLKNLNL